MNILLASWAPFHAGAEIAAERLAIGLRDDGHEVTVVLGTKGETLRHMQTAGLDVRFVPLAFTDKLRWFRYLRAQRAIRRILREVQPDVVHANDLPTSQMVGEVAGQLGIPRVCHHRWIFDGTAIDWLNKFGAERHLFVSSALMNALCSASGRLVGSPRAVVHDGLPLPPLPAGGDRLRARQSLGLPGDKTIVLFAGQIVERKGVEDLLRAWQLLNSPWAQRAALVIVGDDLKNHGEYRRQMESLASEINSPAKFVGFQTNVSDWLTAADFCVVPSHAEPLGNATLEAMAHCLPVIGANVGGIPEMIVDAETGLLVPPKNPALLAAAIEQLIQDDGLRLRLGRSGRARCEENFSLQAHTQAVVDEYQRALGAAGRKDRMNQTLVIAQVFPPQVGGSGRWLWDVHSQIPREQVAFAARQIEGCEAFDKTHDLTIFRVPLELKSLGVLGVRNAAAYWRVYRQLREIVRERKTTEIHAARCLPEGFLAWMLKLRCGIPYHVFAHGEEYTYVRYSRELSWMARNVLRDADLLVANSRNTARVLHDEWSVAAQRVRVLHPGVDTDTFCPAPRDPEIRQGLGWGDRRVILTVGRLQKRKGQEQIIRAMPEIRKNVPDALYAIVGDGDERGRIAELINELGLGDCVRMHGELAPRELLQAYQQCDVFALANLNYQGDFEGFGIVLLEAQSCGKPVIAGESGGTSETMDAPTTGRIVPQSQPQLLARTLTELLSDAELRERMGRAGRAWVLANFDQNVQAEKARRLFYGDQEPARNGRLHGQLLQRMGRRTDLSAQNGTPETTRRDAVSIPLRVSSGTASYTTPVPVSIGLPCPKNAIDGHVEARLCGESVYGGSVQVEPLLHWPGGSAKWLLADFLASPAALSDGTLSLQLQSADPADEGDESPGDMSLVAETDGWSITTGTHRFSISRSKLQPFSVVTADRGSDAKPYVCKIVLTDARGQTHSPVVREWQIERQGPVHTTFVGEGHFPRVRELRVRVRASIFAGTGLVKLEITLHNPHRARHPGGLWDLGDAGSILVEDCSIEISLPDEHSPRMAWSSGPGAVPVVADEAEFSLYQDSSGGESWNSCNHVNRDGRVPCQFRGYQLSVGGRRESGHRISPTLCVQSGATSVTAAIPEFWQQFPKAMSVDAGRLRCGLFPSEFADRFEIQGGERKTHVVWLKFDNAANNDAVANCRSLDWVHQPLVVWPSREWCDQTNALPQLGIAAAPTREKLESLLDEALVGSSSIPAHREQADEYGWRNYGDVFADHEQLHYTGAEPLVSHYNNQFDMLNGFLLQCLRTGDRTWWELGDALARHVVDIDIYNTNEDRPSYNGGMFWFSDHYLHAHTSTHRTYSRANRRHRPKSYGGGPSAEHNFTSGLLLHYCLTGNRDSRDAVIGLANWVIGMNDGRRNLLGILDDSETGAATPMYNDRHRLGRASGNSINALLDAWNLTRQDEYLDYAELYIRRCVHPDDDVAARQLLEVERSWSYTVFLNALQKYLEMKAAAGQLDWMYEYAQKSLTRYVEWMAKFERPYFDQIKELEFPTEAWAAQEFRKANVMRLAAAHCDEPLRGQLLERGDELADRAWQDLLQFESRTTARSLAIMLNEGLTECGLRTRPAPRAPRVAARSSFGERTEFVSQREQINRALSTPPGAARLLGRLANPVRWLRYWHSCKSNGATIA